MIVLNTALSLIHYKSNNYTALIITQLMHTLQPFLLFAALQFPPNRLIFLAPSLLLILCNPNYIFVCACVRNRSLASESHHAWQPQCGSPCQSPASLCEPGAHAQQRARARGDPAAEPRVKCLWKREFTGSCWSLLFLYGAATALAC